MPSAIAKNWSQTGRGASVSSMQVDERTVALAVRDDIAMASEVGWFAAKQPGLLRFIENRVGTDGDATAMAVELCWRVVAAFERQRGLPMPRLDASELERAEDEVVRESRGELSLATGVAYRQPALCSWLELASRRPRLPVTPQLRDRVAVVTAATISACDYAHHAVPRNADQSRSAGVLIG